MKPLIIIPTYNEIESIPIALDGVRARTDADILVVDDNSPDGTGAFVADRAETDPSINLLARPGKAGLAQAYIAGFTWGIERGYTHLVQMDADGSHRPADLPRLLARAGEADLPDLVIGSRWIRGGSVVDWSPYRQAISRVGNLYIRAMLSLPYSDITAGYRVYRADRVAAIDLTQIRVAGYYWQTDMTQRLHEAGSHIVEIPIIFHERNAGQSKLSGAIFTESFKETTQRGLRRLLPGRSAGSGPLG